MRAVGLERGRIALISCHHQKEPASIRDLGTLSGTLEPAVFRTASWRIRLAAYGARLERVLG